MDTEQKAEEDYLRKMKIVRSFSKSLGRDEWDEEIDRSFVLGRNILWEEIGRFGTWEGENYSFDDKTRNRLIAHSRQDIAATYGIAISAFRAANEARRTTKIVFWMILIDVVLTIAVLAFVW